MKFELKFALFALAVSTACFSSRLLCAADDNPTPPVPADVKADNTKINTRDRNSNEVTADQQKQNKSDIELVASIRREVVKDKTLSTNAHNVKIITQNGMVTLKGPVKSDAEKSTIDSIAKREAGEKNVTNQIEIAP